MNCPLCGNELKYTSRILGCQQEELYECKQGHYRTEYAYGRWTTFVNGKEAVDIHNNYDYE